MAERWPGPDTGLEPFPVGDAGTEAFPGDAAGLELFPAGDAAIEVFPGPDAATEQFPPIPTFAVLVDASASGIGIAGALVIAIPWRVAPAAGLGSAGADVAVVVELDAAAAGLGTAGAKFVKDVIDATAAGAGTADALMIPSVAAGASAAGIGTAGMDGYPIAVVEAFATASGSGSAAVIPGVHISAHAAGSGAAGATAVPVAEATAAAAGVGTAGAEVVTFTPSQMIRSGASPQVGTSPTKVTGWVADTTNYPGSVVTDNELVVVGDADNATVTASVEFQNDDFSPRTATLRLYLADQIEPIATGSLSIPATFSGGLGTVVATATGVAVSDGQLIEVRASSNVLNSLNATANAASYVRVFTPE